MITSENAPGIYNINSSGSEMICNDIIADNGFFGSFYTSGIWNDVDSDDAYLESNILESPLDLYTESTIRNQFHTGNCFNGDRVEANGFSDQDVLFLGMIFDVNGNDEPCYFESNHSPPGWFDNNPGQALTCDGLPGTEISGPTDTTRICRYLEYLNEQLQNSTRHDLALMRLLSLFRMYSDTTGTEEFQYPECLTTYIDTTTVCGIEIILTMDSLVTTATVGSDSIRTKIQVQSTLTYLTLLQWRNYNASSEGNSQIEKDSLRQVYITELTRLRTLIQVKRNEEDRIWTTIDSIEIVECLDSIFIIETIGTKLIYKETFSESEKIMIDRYSKYCAKEYGRGIHVMRALASRFSDEDYRKYDIECGNSEEIEQRELSSEQLTREVAVIPNPSRGNITVQVEEPDKAMQLLVTDLNGSIYYTTQKVYSSQNTSINNSGVYILHLRYNDKTSVYEKFVILD